MSRTINHEGNWVVTDGGDVVHPHDVGIVEIDDPLTADERDEAVVAAYEAEQADIAAIRSTADFTRRNRNLYGMTSKLGKVNQHNGAAGLLAEGRYVPYYESAESAERSAVFAAEAAHNLGQKACETCPLVRYCPIASDTDELAKTIRDKATRTRFRARVKSPANNHFCETDAKPGRLKKDEA